MTLNTNKSLKKYYSISEVAAQFGVAESVLRYWEKEFPQIIAPRKSGRNVRQYSKEDIEQVRLVYNLLKVRGMKIAAAREALTKNRQGASSMSEMLDRLKAVRDELVSIRRELNNL
ncbi:MAG: MerR family transcriptional regulator [Bacteroidaceae bacterium]|jgi:DNA-binding transcriptional MerR regulator|nr:MerR family transcriptional regulator [Bacteroidaceae bacterium]MBQ7685312.1 MerR family transcriptional regulator [Bacteroidaceae bacterium]